jgi:monofunctional biosynthetic peptidoglycan transglycosylase
MLSRAMGHDQSLEPGPPPAAPILDQPSPTVAAGEVDQQAIAEPQPEPLPTADIATSQPLPAAESLSGAEPSPAAGLPPRRLSRLRRVGRFILKAAVILFVASLALAGLYRFLPPPITPLMVMRLISGEGLHKSWKSYADISPNLARAVIASEDARFCLHNGFDWTAMDKAWQRNQHNKRVLGGSTISNQTAKNVFLWPDRTYIRKGIEFYFTVVIEAFWSKKRILEMYLNVVEWGPGTYGAEAAARLHFKKSAHDLTKRESALLAAILPNPRHWSPSKPSAYIRGRASTIEARMAAVPDPTGNPCQP